MTGDKHILDTGNSKRVFGTAKVGDRGQIVIPKKVRELFQIQPGDTLLILGEENKGLIVSRPELLRDIADQIFETRKRKTKNERSSQFLPNNGDLPCCLCLF